MNIEQTKVMLGVFRSRYDYSPETGIFFNRRYKKPVRRTREGYVILMVDWKTYSAARVAWLLIHGSWPKNCIDHINGNKSDNRIANLRDVTRRINQQNQTIHRAGHIVGTYFHKVARKWAATIWINGRTRHLGLFATQAEAIAARKQADAMLAEREKESR